MFTNAQITQWRTKLSNENLTQAFNNEELSTFSLDRVQPIYEQVIFEIKSRLSSAQFNENGFKLKRTKRQRAFDFCG